MLIKQTFKNKQKDVSLKLSQSSSSFASKLLFTIHKGFLKSLALSGIGGEQVY